MLLITFFLSFALVLIGKYQVPFFSPSLAVRKAMVVVGMLGLGFFIGFKIYDVSSSFVSGFSDGLAGRKPTQ
ncbi:hypothetical protein [Dyadobacter psychrotolerans]|uniref:Uncharacterized protein n=1 Tax=Dyadobacter psychrotolerans TaxID=2541721 RepID=A0A4R5DUV6_9BACT|nr:hypothetical protein [Dyadobacter psychrotolerans]TDE18239.1 hypothetical protein E0F88_01465 [Dyadobacter psychrotolerans]